MAVLTWDGKAWSAHSITRASATKARLDEAVIPRLANALMVAEMDGTYLSSHEVELLVRSIHRDLLQEGIVSQDGRSVCSADRRVAKVALSGYGTGPVKSVELVCRVCGLRVLRRLAHLYRDAERALDARTTVILIGSR